MNGTENQSIKVLMWVYVKQGHRETGDDADDGA